MRAVNWSAMPATLVKRGRIFTYVVITCFLKFLYPLGVSVIDSGRRIGAFSGTLFLNASGSNRVKTSIYSVPSGVQIVVVSIVNFW